MFLLSQSKGFEGILGVDHPVTLAIHNLVVALEQRRGIDEAKQLYDNALHSISNNHITSEADKYDLQELLTKSDTINQLKSERRYMDAKIVCEECLAGELVTNLIFLSVSLYVYLFVCKHQPVYLKPVLKKIEKVLFFYVI